MKTFRTAIVGTGGIAAIHAENLTDLGGRAEIVAAADVDPDRLDAFCDRWDVSGRYPDLATLLREERPDVVHLCTPPGLHKEQVLACLTAGVNVLCEKPPTLSLSDMDEIAAVEKVSGAHFATVFQHRFGSAAVKLRRLVAEGAFGRPLVAVCNTLWYRPVEYFAVPWRGKWEIEGGGPTMGHGIHQFDLLLSILGEWEEITAVAARQARPTATEDFSAGMVRFANGAVASIVNSLLSPRETSYLRFDFEYATVEVEHLYGYGDENWKVTPAPGHEEAVRLAWESGESGVPSGHGAQFTALFDALEAGEALPVTVEQSRATMEFVAATYASAFSGRAVRRGEIGPDSAHYRRMDGAGAPWAAESPEPSEPSAAAPTEEARA
ncbi:Gfo/Idh/MocA family protein [Allostreptomyces psammosilenae]|uniref:Putative dehydrogenase n=1 Tax=Allostreptomyces psammosilenae TaxID=1892865 RepID=A0A853A758_9ACTN|nr:Gfo/Idh/MocA family oxidoreductase [Allostreptomyces psammosilenae]NYI06378.1 putative dehydrogenase [Allostreptomyces psammosilenae]